MELTSLEYLENTTDTQLSVALKYSKATERNTLQLPQDPSEITNDFITMA